MDWSFTPNYIWQTEAQVALGTVTAARWNELWNLNITQGDHSEIALNALINTSLPAFEAELKAYTDTLEGELATTAGASKIGINAITGVMGTTVQAVAAGLKSLIDTCYRITDATVALALKESVADANALVKTVSFDAATGTFVFTHQSGSTTVIDTNFEKAVVNFSYDHANQRLVLVDTIGNTSYISLSDFITETEFVDSAQLDFSVNAHSVTATIKSGSITDDLLSSALITTLQGYVSSANTAATNAAASEANASTYKTNAANSAAAASDSAASAASAATSSSNSASSALSSKNAAATSASNAATSAQSAADSASQAAAIVGGEYLLKTGDASNTTVTYTEAASKTALASGEKLSVALGKIKKWFSSLGSAAFTESSAYETAGNISTHNAAGNAHSSLFAAKQDKIAVSGLLKGDGAGGVIAAVLGSDYYGIVPADSIEDLNNFITPGIMEVNTAKTNKPADTAQWATVWNICGNNTGSMLIQYYFNAANGGLYKRYYVDTVWYEWRKEIDSLNVGSQNVNYAQYSSLPWITDPGTSSLKSVLASTTDLTAGTSALTTGTVYLVYE